MPKHLQDTYQHSKTTYNSALNYLTQHMSKADATAARGWFGDFDGHLYKAGANAYKYARDAYNTYSKPATDMLSYIAGPVINHAMKNGRGRIGGYEQLAIEA